MEGGDDAASVTNAGVCIKTGKTAEYYMQVGAARVRECKMGKHRGDVMPERKRTFHRG